MKQAMLDPQTPSRTFDTGVRRKPIFDSSPGVYILFAGGQGQNAIYLDFSSRRREQLARENPSHKGLAPRRDTHIHPRLQHAP
jgi:hypothetical protein